uniref:Calcium-binding and coiled-coil domain-containing protein 2 n=1 Tax=Calidris pygmaea TaxID=425635 RepID=A0A8C3KE52_9CHAR
MLVSGFQQNNCHFSQVVFNNVEKFYIPGGDITCYYTLTQNIIPRGKDWVGIFRVGWKTTREYYTFMWAPLPSDAPSDTPSDTTVQQQIQFKGEWGTWVTRGAYVHVHTQTPPFLPPISTAFGVTGYLQDCALGGLFQIA